MNVSSHRGALSRRRSSNRPSRSTTSNYHRTIVPQCFSRRLIMGGSKRYLMPLTSRRKNARINGSARRGRRKTNGRYKRSGQRSSFPGTPRTTTPRTFHHFVREIIRVFRHSQCMGMGRKRQLRHGSRSGTNGTMRATVVRSRNIIRRLNSSTLPPRRLCPHMYPSREQQRVKSGSRSVRRATSFCFRTPRRMYRQRTRDHQWSHKGSDRFRQICRHSPVRFLNGRVDRVLGYRHPYVPVGSAPMRGRRCKVRSRGNRDHGGSSARGIPSNRVLFRDPSSLVGISSITQQGALVHPTLAIDIATLPSKEVS